MEGVINYYKAKSATYKGVTSIWESCVCPKGEFDEWHKRVGNWIIGPYRSFTIKVEVGPKKCGAWVAFEDEISPTLKINLFSFVME